MQPLSWFLPTESESSDDRSAASNPGQAPSAGTGADIRDPARVHAKGNCGGAGRNRTADKGFCLFAWGGSLAISRIYTHVGSIRVNGRYWILKVRRSL